MMKVDRIAAQVWYSQDTGQEARKAVEIGGEATVGEREQWAEALAHLYAHIGREFKPYTLSANAHHLVVEWTR